MPSNDLARCSSSPGDIFVRITRGCVCIKDEEDCAGCGGNGNGRPKMEAAFMNSISSYLNKDLFTDVTIFGKGEEEKFGKMFPSMAPPDYRECSGFGLKPLQEVKAHKIVLASASPYLAQMLKNSQDGGNRNGGNTIICLPSVKASLIRKMLILLYDGDVKVSKDKELESFLKLINDLKITSVDVHHKDKLNLENFSDQDDEQDLEFESYESCSSKCVQEEVMEPKDLSSRSSKGHKDHFLLKKDEEERPLKLPELELPQDRESSICDIDQSSLSTKDSLDKAEFSEEKRLTMSASNLYSIDNDDSKLIMDIDDDSSDTIVMPSALAPEVSIKEGLTSNESGVILKELNEHSGERNEQTPFPFAFSDSVSISPLPPTKHSKKQSSSFKDVDDNFNSISTSTKPSKSLPSPRSGVTKNDVSDNINDSSVTEKQYQDFLRFWSGSGQQNFANGLDYASLSRLSILQYFEAFNNMNNSGGFSRSSSSSPTNLSANHVTSISQSSTSAGNDLMISSNAEGRASLRSIRNPSSSLYYNSKQKRYVECTKCSKTLSSLSALKRHMEDVHCARIQGKCLICFRVYSSRNSLLTHVYSAHKKHPDYKAVARIIRESEFQEFTS